MTTCAKLFARSMQNVRVYQIIHCPLGPSHGYDFLLMERRCFPEVLYESLSDKSRILMTKGVRSIQEHKEEVEAF